jgi:hypothetical protein
MLDDMGGVYHCNRVGEKKIELHGVLPGNLGEESDLAGIAVLR